MKIQELHLEKQERDYSDFALYYDVRKKIGFEAEFDNGEFNGIVCFCENIGDDYEEWKPVTDNELYEFVKTKAIEEYTNINNVRPYDVVVESLSSCPMEANYSFQPKTYVKPTEERYEKIGEKTYSKYSCPVCALLGNKHQVSMGESHCSLCNVNLQWGEKNMEKNKQTNPNYTSMSMEELIGLLRESHQMDIYTVDENWCIQLFDLDVCANDIGISCDYETNGKNLQSVLIEALEWSEKRKDDE